MDDRNNYGTFGDATIGDLDQLKNIVENKDVNLLTRKVAALKKWALEKEREAKKD